MENNSVTKHLEARSTRTGPVVTVPLSHNISESVYSIENENNNYCVVVLQTIKTFANQPTGTVYTVL